MKDKMNTLHVSGVRLTRTAREAIVVVVEVLSGVRRNE